MSIEFWKNVVDGLDTAASEYNINYEYTAPDTDADVDVQIDLINAAIKKKPNAIILAASDYYKLVESSEKIVNSRIKLIMLDSDVNYSGKISLIGTDNFNAGLNAGQFMKKILKENKKTVILSQFINAKSATDREEGIIEGVGAEFVSNTYNCYASSEIAYDTVYKLIDKTSSLYNPEIEGIFAINEVVALGAAKAIDALEAYNNIKLIVFDSSINLIKYIEKGVITTAIVQKPFNMGYTAMKTTADILNGKKVSVFIDTGNVLVNKENMYTHENQKLLFPFQ